MADSIKLRGMTVRFRTDPETMETVFTTEDGRELRVKAKSGEDAMKALREWL